MRIDRKSCVGTDKLIAMTNLPSIQELSLRSNTMIAWRTLSENDDLRDLATPRLRLQSHGLHTGSAASGTLVQETTFSSFLKKSGVPYNTFSEKVKAGSKENVNLLIKRDFKTIQINLNS
jgi:hypothetical protein